MPEENITLVAVYEFNPSSPDNPLKNHWNADEGEVIVDDFQPGRLSTAVSETANGNDGKVQSIIVAGPISQYDWGVANSFPNCTILDLSRTYGMTYVPSWNFSNNTTLTKICLPSSIERIEYNAFQGCTSLNVLNCHATTPPVVGPGAFDGVQGLVVHVPANSVALYQDADVWKDFTILPFEEEVSALEVNFPAGVNMSDYKDMFIELVSTTNGQKLRYVVTERTSYTFNSLIHRTSYVVRLVNSRGDVLGEIGNIDIVDKDVSVTFSNLRLPQNISIQVLTPDNSDVTSDVVVTWTDANGAFLVKGSELNGQVQGSKVTFSISLPQSLGIQYVQPKDSIYTVLATGNIIKYQLAAIPQTTMAGQVLDVKTSLPLSGATVAVSQTLNGQYSKTLTAKTDGQGRWSMDVFDAPTEITASMTDYVSQSLSLDKPVSEVPAFQLKDISGTTIAINLTYTTTDSNTVDFYSDYANVAYAVYDAATEQQITDLNIQYPQIVLMEQHAEGTAFRIVATSKNQKFEAVEAVATVDSLDRATVTLPIKQFGGIAASFSQAVNTGVVGILYDAKGNFLKKYNYATTALTINELRDGDYTLVTMGSSTMFNSIYSLSQFAESGLTEGTDYVVNNVTVVSGEMAEVSNDLIPFFDETKLYYTGNGTSFTVNKSQVTAGQYLTLSSHLDFRSTIADKVGDVQLIVNLPENSSLVDNSVMVGNSTSGYTYADHVVTIPLANYADRVRFCIIPSLGGEYNPTASVQFVLDGESITQPIGNVNFEVKNLTINVPSIVAKKTVPVSGMGAGKSSVEIYDNGTLVGQSTTNGNGYWRADIELNEAYNLSTHEIYAKLITENGMEMLTETRECMYDMNAIEPKSITMSFYNGWMKKNIEVVFDYATGKPSTTSYSFYTGTDFTFVADFTNNDTTVISNVFLAVRTDKGNELSIPMSYDSKKDRWIAVKQFDSKELPVNVRLKYISETELLLPYSKHSDSEIEVANLCREYFIEKESISLLLEQAKSDIENSSTDYEMLSAYDAFESILSNINQTYNLGISYETSSYYDSLSDEEIEIREEEDNARITELLDDITLDITQIDKLLSYSNIFELTDKDLGTMVKSTTCNGLTADLLLSMGYQSFKTDIEGTVYLKMGNDTISYANFDDNIYQTIILSEIDKVILNRAGFIDCILFDQEVAEKIKESLLKMQEIRLSISLLLSHLKTATINNVADRWEEMLSKSMELQEELLKFRDYGSNLYLYMVDAFDGFIKAKYEKYWKLSSELGICKAHAARTKNIDKKLFWKSLAQRVEEDRAMLALFFKQKWLVNTGKFLAKYAPITNVVYALASAAEDIAKIVGVASVIFPCDNDFLNACNTMLHCINQINFIGSCTTTSLAAEAVIDACTVVSSETIIGGILCVGIKIGVSWCIDKYKRWELDHRIDALQSEVERLRCYVPNNGGNKLNNGRDGIYGNWWPFDPVHPILDPSGYVYEAIPANRVEGATASIYYKEEMEDMYGVKQENVVLWDAEEYAQKNPLFTDENGMYQWDVPQGLWQVKFEKEGYETAYSEWLPVPPPQLDVNVELKQNKQPEVKMAHAYEDAVEVEFDKYMMPELLTTNSIKVMANGQNLEGTIELLDEAAVADDDTKTFASKVRFNAAQPFDAEEITLVVNNQVKSYAGIRMQDDYLQTFTVEPEIKEIVCEPNMLLGYGDTISVTVDVLPVKASAGKTLKLKSSSPVILSTLSESVVIGEDGKATFRIGGELPGTAGLTYTVDGYDITATTTVNVSPDFGKVTATPVSNIVSGSLVSEGTFVTLTCSTQGATIYYTLDGSCPCDETKRIVYDGTPIVVDRNVVVKAIAVAPNMEDSEIMNAVYIVLTGDVNNDKRVGIGDIIAVTSFVAGDANGLPMEIADVNRDGKVGIGDVIAITNIVAGNTYASPKHRTYMIKNK